MEYILDATRLCQKKPAHDYLTEVFKFPDYYGRNLDALYDCLSELDNISIKITNSEAAFGYYFKVLKVLKEFETIIE